MGPSRDPLAVVNHELKVHGIKNLRVIDASVMPKVREYFVLSSSSSTLSHFINVFL